MLAILSALLSFSHTARHPRESGDPHQSSGQNRSVAFVVRKSFISGAGTGVPIKSTGSA